MEQRKKTDKFDIKIGRIIPGLRTILFYFNNKSIILLKLFEDEDIYYQYYFQFILETQTWNNNWNKKRIKKKNRYKNSKNYSNYSKDFRTILLRLIEEG